MRILTEETSMRKCPRCGYLRKPGDLGLESECPQCGIVYDKWRKKRLKTEGSGAGVEGGAGPGAEQGNDLQAGMMQLAGIVAERRKKKAQKRNLMFIGAGVLLAVLVVFLVTHKDEAPAAPGKAKPVLSPRQDQIAKRLKRQAAAVAENKPPPEVKVTVMPGESKSLVVSCFFPILHRDAFDFDFSTDFSVAKNEVEAQGVEVAVDNVELSPVTHAIWEFLNREKIWRPVGSYDIPVSYLGPKVSGGGAYGEENVFVSYPEALIKFNNITEEKLVAQERRRPEGLQRADYRFYKADVYITVDVPTFFDSPKFSGLVAIKAGSVSFHNKLYIKIPNQWIYFDVWHGGEKKGVVFRLESSSSMQLRVVE